MKKNLTQGQSCEFTIRGDELEQHRIQLEHNLQHTDLSLHLSSAPDDYCNSEHSSVELPRHNSGPSPFADFASFEQQSRDHFGIDSHNPLHAWSYRTVEDEEGINPYAGETISTAAHHASALTLSAGLMGRVTRRDASLSGAEYDPDRPVQRMITGADGKQSVIEGDPSNSRQSVVASDARNRGTVELDRVLQSGHPKPSVSRSIRIDSRQSSTSSSDLDTSNSMSRPKLVDALRRVSFSPKRPRSAQSHYSYTSSHPQLHPEDGNLDSFRHPSQRIPPSPLAQHHAGIMAPTPKARPRQNILPSRVSFQPELRLQPPTPSSPASHFMKMATSLEREIEAEKDADVWDGNQKIRTSQRIHASRRSSIKTARSSKSLVQLPDVTGLTSAVESPTRLMLKHFVYHPDSGLRETDACLLSTLNAVQSKLIHLEAENGISRRRVRELELELDACKKEVARERTRVLERDEVIVQQQQDVDNVNTILARKGKERVKDADHVAKKRYREVVEEKKALEALITTLRAHLTRLTRELSSHHLLLVDLQSLRESDSLALKAKSLEVDSLRQEVERLAGEVEVLRAVVEEGLKERRLVREQHSHGHPSCRENGQQCEQKSGEQEVPAEGENEYPPAAESEGEDLEYASQHLHPSALPDRIVPTHATLDTLNPAPSQRPTNFEGLERVDDSKLELSGSVLLQRRSQQSPPLPLESCSPVRSQSSSPRSRKHESPIDDRFVADPVSPDSPLTGLAIPQVCQPTSSKPASSAEIDSHRKHINLESDAPFPQIRGSRLERIFFSTPVHNLKTCTFCNRRRPFPLPTLSSWLPNHRYDLRVQLQDVVDTEEDDEGFVEGVEDVGLQGVNSKQDRREDLRKKFKRSGLPPQTVLTRVVRELEDEFAHYKSIYVELADEYKALNAVSNRSQRNILAQHLREVIDILEQKGSQVVSLYDLLSFRDKPLADEVPLPSCR